MCPQHLTPAELCQEGASLSCRLRERNGGTSLRLRGFTRMQGGQSQPGARAKGMVNS